MAFLGWWFDHMLVDAWVARYSGFASVRLAGIVLSEECWVVVTLVFAC